MAEGGLIAKEYHMAPLGRHMLKNFGEEKKSPKLSRLWLSPVDAAAVWQRFRACFRFHCLSHEGKGRGSSSRSSQSASALHEAIIEHGKAITSGDNRPVITEPTVARDGER